MSEAPVPEMASYYVSSGTLNYTLTEASYEEAEMLNIVIVA